MSAKKGGLGKGLDAIFIENDTENKTSVMLKISEIEPNREQPRNDFDEKAGKKYVRQEVLQQKYHPGMCLLRQRTPPFRRRRNILYEKRYSLADR